jgi:putative zinc finger/helix-turn-helix YgiT family protein
MNYKLECPICEGKASLIIEEGINTFRKEKFQIHSYFYKCSKCGEEFTTTELDQINVAQVYNQYRELHNIPSAEQFRLIRELYNLSASKMSLILGIGQNQYSLYESGEIPNESNSQLIFLITDPKVFKSHLLKRKPILQPKDYDKILDHLEILIHNEEDNCSSLEKVLFNSFSTPSHFNGFKMPSLEKFANMVIYFLDAAFLVTRLNKFLFYSDFYNYKQTGFSISGYNYAAIPRGPVPDKYKIIFNLLEEKGFILTEDYLIGGEYTEKFIPAVNFNPSLFNKNELESMETVKNKLSSFSTDKIIDMSHDELGWSENKDKKDLISYQKYASLLRHF